MFSSVFVVKNGIGVQRRCKQTMKTCKKEIQSFCSSCRETYNPDTNSVICPHIGFPRTKLCKHNRINCGHIECNTEELKLLKFPTEKRA